MERIYLVWYVEDVPEGGLDADGDIRETPRSVVIRESEEEARKVAVEMFDETKVGQLVIEVTPSGTARLAFFAGTLGREVLGDYGKTFTFFSRESEHAITAAVVKLMTGLKKGAY